jgi:RsiW-degrading membrane proteinase PrsW (M82 family)
MPTLIKNSNHRLDKDSKLYLVLAAIIIALAIFVFAWYERKFQRMESEMHQIRTHHP